MLDRLQSSFVPPPGAVAGDYGDAPASPQPWWFDEYVAGTLVNADVTPEVVGGANGTTILRVDFEVAYSPVRPKGEEVTAADRYVSISRSTESFPTPSPARELSFADPATVVGLADAFNALAATTSGTMSCPPPMVTYTIAFSASPTSSPDFVAEGPGCLAWYVTSGGGATGELLDSSALESLLSSLVGP
jgi:hypothetical protein